MATWQVQQAKSRLSELIEAAKTSGPQIITKHGAETAVVISISEYKALKHPEPRMNFVDFLLSAPKFESDEEHEEFRASLRYPDETERYRALDKLFEEADSKESQVGDK